MTHQSNGSGLQNHSIGDLYPWVIEGRGTVPTEYRWVHVPSGARGNWTTRQAQAESEARQNRNYVTTRNKQCKALDRVKHDEYTAPNPPIFGCHERPASDGKRAVQVQVKDALRAKISSADVNELISISNHLLYLESQNA